MILSPSPCFNDLIGLQYDWSSSPSDGNGKTNCFAMCMEARKRLGLTDFRDQFSELYKNTSQGEISVRQILRLLRRYCHVIYDPRPGAIFCLPSRGNGIAMVVIIDDQDCLMLSPDSYVTRLPFAKVTKGKYYWVE